MSEPRQCQNCRGAFTVAPEDFGFYEKIGVPPPTWCPPCREQRRMAWRNVRALHRRKCSAPGHGEDIISIFSADKPFIVYDQSYWWSDAWDPLDYGAPYDFVRPFFTQFKELLLRVPHPNLTNRNPMGTDYSNMTVDSKDCYLLFSSTRNEECMYGEGLRHSKQCVSCMYVLDSEQCYECINCEKCYRLSFGRDCENCMDSQYLFDCRNCRNCFGCWNLRNKQYHIFNQPYTKEDYAREIEKMRTGSFRASNAAAREFAERLTTGIRRYAQITASQAVTGDRVDHAKRCTACFEVSNLEDSKFATKIYEGGSENYDITVAVRPELSYECAGGGSAYHNMFCSAIIADRDLTYSQFCFDSHDLFGCIGLRKKEYCILNRQYSKEEYEELVPRIIAQMNAMPYSDHLGRTFRYGEFFPPEISTFGYNETMAQEYYPLSRDEALAAGYTWKEAGERSYAVTMSAEKIPDAVEETDDAIAGEVIGCAHAARCAHECSTAFRVLPAELAFYRRLFVPLSRLCPNCRHGDQLERQNPMKLWHRQCMCNAASGRNTAKHDHHSEGRCANEFETPYAPERSEVVYCESCYNAEVV